MANATADTPAQWLELLRAAFFTGTPNAGVDPLANAPSAAIRKFSESLVFAGGGLGHADYSGFLGVISAAQFSALWAAFGISDSLIIDYENKFCREPGTCAKENGSICTSNC